MTISSTVRIAGPFTGNGVTTTFPFTYKVFSTADVQVIRLTISTGIETTLTIVTDYTITLNGDQDSNPGGNIVLVAALSALYKLTATSDIANLQPTDLTNQGGFYPEVITDALDRATIQIQQISDIGERTLKIPISDGALNMELPTAASRANSFLAFGATGLPTVVTAGSSGAPTTMTRQNFSGTGSQVAFTLASDPGALGNSAEVFIGGVYQNRNTYTISGLTLTFSAAPVAGTDNIEFVNFLTDAIGSTSADLVTYTPAGTGAVARSAQSKFRDIVSVKDFGAVGDGVTNDTTAFVNAFATGKATYAPAGTYLVSILDIPSNTFLFGDGSTTIIKPLTPTVRCALGADSGSSSTYIENITIRDVRFLGTVAVDAFSEQKHLTSFNGVKNMLIENCDFVGFRGDGLYLGSGNSGGQERHNINVIIRSCFFDGVNNDNRNGISVTDCDNCIIDSNYFINTTKSTMPGSIDIEPDQIFNIINGITISNNRISNSLNTAISIFITDYFTNPSKNIVIVNNTINNCVYGISAAQSSAAITNLSDSSIDTNVLISSNNISVCTTALYTYGFKKCIIEKNHFLNCTSHCIIGSGTFARTIGFNYFIDSNMFFNCGSVSGFGCKVDGITNIYFSKNIFNDCGAGAAGNTALNFIPSFASAVTVSDFTSNTFLTPTAKTLIATNETGAGTISCSYGVVSKNKVNSLATIFPEDIGTFIPAFSATGSTFAYATNGQVGRYTRTGNRINFSITLILATSGNTLAANSLTITGLPIAAATASNTAYVSTCLWAAITTSLVNMQLQIVSNASSMTLHKTTAAGVTSATAMVATDLHATNGSIIEITGCYEISASL